MLVSGRLSPIRSCTGLTLDVEAITATISRIIQPVIAITVLTLPAIMSGSGSLYLCRPEREYKFKCVKSKEILIMHTFFVQERRKHEYEKNKY